MSVEVKKPVTVKDVRKVKKTQYIKQKAPAANGSQGRANVDEELMVCFGLPIILTEFTWITVWIQICKSCTLDH